MYFVRSRGSTVSVRQAAAHALDYYKSTQQQQQKAGRRGGYCPALAPATLAATLPAEGGNLGPTSLPHP